MKETLLLTVDEVRRMNAYWRAANYLSVGQIYLYDNPLLRESLTLEHVKPRLLGHWGTTPGLNFVYVHLNRLIKLHDLNVIYLAGPGHGGPGVVANTYLEGTYSEFYPNITQDAEGMKKLFKQFSFPGGIPSHVAPETPGSIHEGGELGYSLVHAYDAVFDNPDLLAACVIGDGEAETGPLAASWHSNKFLSPARDGVVLPILHLNGYKIANPTVLARLCKEELTSLLVGYGHKPYFVEGDDPETMHQLMAATLDKVIAEIQTIQKDSRENGFTTRPQYPMIVLRTPKGWTGPKVVDGLPAENSFRSHQVPLDKLAKNPEHLRQLEETMAFTTLILFQLFNVFNARSDERSAFVGLFKNRWLWGAILLSLALQVAVIYIPFLQHAFSTVSLSFGDWLRCMAVASSVLWLRELGKVVIRARSRR